MSPLLAASHNSSGGLDAVAVAGVGAGWVADGVAMGGGADATCVSVFSTGEIGVSGAVSAGGAGRAACVVVSARALAIGALCRAAAFRRATRAWVDD
jgi:hypothetical protein